MPTAEQVLAALKSKGKENTRKLFSRHGMPYERLLGVNVPDIKLIAKSIKGQQALALEVYKSGKMEAMYLSGMVADGAKMTREQLNEWAEGAADIQMISEHTVAWVTIENEHARDLAMKWITSKKESVAASGWCTYSGLVATKPDSELDLKEIESLLAKITKEIHSAQNRVRYTMNGFVIHVGGYVMPLTKQAKAVAQKIGAVTVEMGETECKVPSAMTYIEKMEAAGKAGKKKKTIRC